MGERGQTYVRSPDDEKLGQITQYLCGFADSENRLTTK